MHPDERALVLQYAPAGKRAGFAALLALDAKLAAILRSTSEPLLGQMRLTWWHDALIGLGQGAAPAEPVLRALAEHVTPVVAGDELAAMVDGWETLLAQPFGETEMRDHGEQRGARLFALAGRLLGASDDRPAVAGAGWALADLSHHLSDRTLAKQARVQATELLKDALAARWPGPTRPLGALAHLARLDLTTHAKPAGHPMRAARLLWHRLTGR